MISLLRLGPTIILLNDLGTEIDTDIEADDSYWAENERQDPGSLTDKLEQRKANGPDNY
ncbi:MAG TPA: hypothetical protein VKA15_15700 [Isosphaeraceae bacterium]|nr:hypothetical protein [Isosphaeraceae bacterium]